MEHLNRLVKVAIEGLGANKSEKAIIRCGKAIGFLGKAMESYDSEVGVATTSATHAKTSIQKDLELTVKQLLECDVFDPATKSTHKSFCHLKTNLFKTLEEKPLKEWIVEHFSQTLSRSAPPPIHSDVEDSDDNDEQ